MDRASWGILFIVFCIGLPIFVVHVIIRKYFPKLYQEIMEAEQDAEALRRARKNHNLASYVSIADRKKIQGSRKIEHEAWIKWTTHLLQEYLELNNGERHYKLDADKFLEEVKRTLSAYCNKVEQSNLMYFMIRTPFKVYSYDLGNEKALAIMREKYHMPTWEEYNASLDGIPNPTLENLYFLVEAKVREEVAHSGYVYQAHDYELEKERNEYKENFRAKYPWHK